jgi:hypothetical protein
MVFGKINKNRNTFKPKISINGEILEIVTETKFLGIILDAELSWKKHIMYT